MNDDESLWVTIARAAVTVGSAAAVAYLLDADFRRAVDKTLQTMDYRSKLARWKARYWYRWPGWQREIYESQHGSPE